MLDTPKNLATLPGWSDALVRELAGAAGWTVAGFETSPDPAVALALLEA